MLFLLAIEDWYVEVKNFINYELNNTAYIAIVSLLAISIIAIIKYIAKYGFNLNVVKKNMVFPVVLGILIGVLLVFFASAKMA